MLNNLSLGAFPVRLCRAGRKKSLSPRPCLTGFRRIHPVIITRSDDVVGGGTPVRIIRCFPHVDGEKWKIIRLKRTHINMYIYTYTYTRERRKTGRNETTRARKNSSLRVVRFYTRISAKPFTDPPPIAPFVSVCLSVVGNFSQSSIETQYTHTHTRCRRRRLRPEMEFSYFRFRCPPSHSPSPFG